MVELAVIGKIGSAIGIVYGAKKLYDAYFTGRED